MALSEAEHVEPARKGPRCSVCVVMESMDADDAATLTRWLEDVALYSSTIEERLRRVGILHISAGTVSRHRAARCWERRRATV